MQFFCSNFMGKKSSKLKSMPFGRKGIKIQRWPCLECDPSKSFSELLCRKPGAENHNQHRCLCPRRWPLFIFCPESPLICSFLGSLIRVRHIQTEDLGKKYWGKMTFSARKKKKKTPKVWSHVCVPSPRLSCYEIYVRLALFMLEKTLQINSGQGAPSRQ